MKIVKLGSIFVAVLGAILGIMYLSGLGGGIESSVEPKTEYAKSFLNRITHDWSMVSQWNDSLYQAHQTEMEQTNASTECFESGDYALVYNRLNKEAFEKVVNAMIIEFHKPYCDNEVIKNNFVGIRVVLNNESSYGENSKYIEIKKCYDLYKDISSFISRSFYVNPEFDGRDGFWNPSFSNYCNNIENQVIFYKGNAMYKEHLSSIIRLNNGLSDIADKLKNAKGRYYSQLFHQIESYYESVDFTENNRDCLEKVYIKFIREYGEDYNVLYRFKRKFSEAVENTVKK